MVRMRLLDEAAQEIKKMDPESAISKNFVRELALEGKIPCVMAGRKRLINFDALLAYLQNSEQPEVSETGIRKVPEKINRV